MLNQAQLIRFEDDGYLIVEDVLNQQDIRTLQSEYEVLIEQIATMQGFANTQWRSLNFTEKLTSLIANHPEAYEYLDISLPLIADMSPSSGVHTGPAVFNLLTHPRILDIAESIKGSEIISNPVQHVRIKPPESALNELGRENSNMARTGWHQYAAVIVEEANNSPILTVWVAITDATPEMGCMQTIRGSHKWSELGMHCPGRKGLGKIFIPNSIVDNHDTVDLGVRAGSIVLLHIKTWHGAGPNTSDRIRWSFDLRYHPPGFNTGRQCFPEFLARSKLQPENVLTQAHLWSALWETARTEITSGLKDATFNERWHRYRKDPLCA